VIITFSDAAVIGPLDEPSSGVPAAPVRSKPAAWAVLRLVARLTAVASRALR
jgi:hypothetical protein